MIRKSLLSVVLLALSSSPIYANETSYKYCLFAGYFGVNTFLGDLSQKLAARDGVIGEGVCQATWRHGYEIGQRAVHGQAKSNEDIKVMLEAGVFSDKVYEFIIKGAGF